MTEKVVYLIEDPTGEAEKGWSGWGVGEDGSFTCETVAKLTKEDLRVMLAALS